MAARAGVRKLVLTHLSARYSQNIGDLAREAREAFAEVVVGKDGMEIDVPYRDAGEESAPPGV